MGKKLQNSNDYNLGGKSKKYRNEPQLVWEICKRGCSELTCKSLFFGALSFLLTLWQQKWPITF